MGESERSFRVVLCRPKFGGNVGSVCRAMKTMGLTDLAIVGEGADEDRKAALANAVHAADVYEAATRVSSLPEAISGCVLVAGTTRRRGKERKRAIMLPEQFARRADEISGRIAIVFGNEETGLTTDELAQCSVAITIPSDPEYPSLNLSHAVQIIAYVLFRHDWALPTYTPVTVSRVGAAVDGIVEDLSTIGHLASDQHGATRALLNDLIGRATATESEIRQLERVFRGIRYRLERNSQ